MPDLTPCGALRLNDKYKTNENTFYFSITFGYRNAVAKHREIFDFPRKYVRKAFGFETEI